MQEYSELIRSLIRLGAVKTREIIDDVIKLLLKDYANELLYLVYSLNSMVNLEVYLRRVRIFLSDKTFSISSYRGIRDGDSAESVSKSILRNVIIGEGKRVVMLFKDDGEVLEKIPTKPQSSITINPAVSFIISTALILFIFILTIRISVMAALLAAAIQAPLVNISYSLLSLERMHKINVNGARIVRVTAIVPPNAPEEVLHKVILLASGIRALRPSNLGAIASALRRVDPKVRISVKVEEIKIPSIKGLEVYLVPSPDCNAVSISLFRRLIIISTKLAACLDQDELTAVIYHELGHISNLDTYKSIAASVAYSLVSMAILLLLIPRMGMTVLSIALYAVIALAAIIISMAVSRFSEVKADEYATRSGFSAPLAMALVKITYPQINSNILKLPFLSHPTTVSRVRNIVKASAAK